MKKTFLSIASRALMTWKHLLRFHLWCPSLEVRASLGGEDTSVTFFNSHSSLWARCLSRKPVDVDDEVRTLIVGNTPNELSWRGWNGKKGNMNIRLLSCSSLIHCLHSFMVISCVIEMAWSQQRTHLDSCPVVQGLDVRSPRHFGEVNTTSAQYCCKACGSSQECQFWSFKASDVPQGHACRLFATLPKANRSEASFVSGPKPPPSPSDIRLHVEGSNLIDPQGKIVRLVGFNWPLEHVHLGDGAVMREKLPGVNLVRLVGVLWDNSKSASDCYSDQFPYFKDSCFARLDTAVRAAVDAKLWVVLAARCEFAAGQAYLTNPMANVFHNMTLRNMLYTAWQHVVKHYQSWDYIAAYEVMAEPRDKLVNASVVREFYAGACSAVRRVEANTPCLVGPSPYYKLWNFNSSILLPNTSNVVYTFDYFQPSDFVFGRSDIPTYPGTYNCSTVYGGEPWVSQCCPGGLPSVLIELNISWHMQNIAQYALKLRAQNVPVIVNQWSAVHGLDAAAGRFRFISDVARTLQEAGIGWAWWVWRGGGDGWDHGSMEIAYYWSNGSVSFDEQALAALKPYV